MQKQNSLSLSFIKLLYFISLQLNPVFQFLQIQTKPIDSLYEQKLGLRYFFGFWVFCFLSDNEASKARDFGVAESTQIASAFDGHSVSLHTRYDHRNPTGFPHRVGFRRRSFWVFIAGRRTGRYVSVSETETANTGVQENIGFDL